MFTSYQVFLETFGVVISPGVAGPEVENAVVGVAVFVFVFVALVSVADVAEPRASVDIALAFDVLVPVSVVAVEVYSSGRPRFLAFPNADYFSSSSSSVDVVGQESVYSPTGVHANYVLCSILSTPGPHQNKNLEHGYNKPNPDYNNASDTNALPMDATTNHSRKKCLHLYQEQRTHTYQATLSPPEVPQIRWVVAEEFQFQYLHLPLPLLEQEQQLPTPKELSLKATFSFYCLL
ncbi:MAG TPA: hypothetical protein VFG06_07475 [Thermodesulfovibrionales bacterium]|jgi:hypothetical protein|nr:hypothetical protein [Thermodesulfovibrionales bacterium]